MSALIVYVGENCWLLENQVMVFIGEISYSWYLVHWPAVALLKMWDLKSDGCKLVIIEAGKLAIECVNKKFFRHGHWYFCIFACQHSSLLSI